MTVSKHIPPITRRGLNVVSILEMLTRHSSRIGSTYRIYWDGQQCYNIDKTQQGRCCMCWVNVVALGYIWWDGEPLAPRVPQVTVGASSVGSQWPTRESARSHHLNSNFLPRRVDGSKQIIKLLLHLSCLFV